MTAPRAAEHRAVGLRRWIAHGAWTLLGGAHPCARLALMCAAILAVMTLLLPGRFLTARNFSALAFLLPELGILAAAIMVSLLSGGIDLSVVSAANLASICAALVLTAGMGSPAAAAAMAVAAALACGLACGALNGFLIGHVGLTPILATLGTMQLYWGIALVITRGPAISGFPETFQSIGNGTWAGVPAPLVLFVLTLSACGIVLSRTRFGISLRLIGTSENAARHAGIDVTRVLRSAYLLTGLLAGIAGVVMGARTNSAKADYGGSYLLWAVLVAILGGVSPHGGSGGVKGLAAALFSLGLLSSGFTMLRISTFVKELVWGAFLIAVMALERFGARTTDRPHAAARRGAETR